jgi:UDP-N-acetylmuramoyl-L-alanyl-D-glutamate--2,6-diaminopimelate ligase
MHPAISRLEQLGIKRKRLVVDSREIRPGDVFAAYPGAATDGRIFIDAAANAGATAVIAQAGSTCAVNASIPVVSVENLSRTIGHVADDFYDRPSAFLSVNAVTGTNGKTTVATWLAQAHSKLSQKCGFIGTLGVGVVNALTPSKNTTPDAATVHGTLAQLRAAGASHVAMEVSSHALDQNRVAGVRFDTALFTNLTQDHLDFHGTMAAYGDAKAKLFYEYAVRHRVINIDDEFGAQLAARRFPNCVTYGLRQGLVRGRVLDADQSSIKLQVSSPWGEVRARVAAIGTFNAYNATAVAASLLCRDVAPDLVAEALQALKPAAGRMQRVDSTAQSPTVLVDYAHTPDALEKAIAAARESILGKLWVVFGCGGDRDASKRPLMGAIASRDADRVVVTSDNPRGEMPQVVIKAILDGVSGEHKARTDTIVDRRDAIRYAIENADSGDTVLIAGKGHEDYQEIAGVRAHFSDVEEAKAALAHRERHWETVHAAHH